MHISCSPIPFKQSDWVGDFIDCDRCSHPGCSWYQFPSLYVGLSQRFEMRVAWPSVSVCGGGIRQSEHKVVTEVLTKSSGRMNVCWIVKVRSVGINDDG